MFVSIGSRSRRSTRSSSGSDVTAASCQPVMRARVPVAISHAGWVLVHPWDAATDDEEWRRFVRARMVGLLVASGRGRDVPVVTPTPYLLGDEAVEFHLARPNPMWRALEENPTAMVVVTGDETYVPAAWKAIGDEDPAHGIPTEYYASVQLVGAVTVYDDDVTKLALLRRQLAAYEPGSGVAD